MSEFTRSFEAIKSEAAHNASSVTHKPERYAVGPLVFRRLKSHYFSRRDRNRHIKALNPIS